MKLPFFKKKQKKEYFLALLLREEKATAVIFEELLGKIRVVGKHEESFETTIEDATENEWLNVLDKTISFAESNLPENIETQKTVFGVKESWVEESKIKKDYLLKLKKVSETLNLSPIGFLVIQEAIAHLLQKEEGVPPSAILIETGHKILTVSLMKAGKILETRRVRIEESVPKTVDRILHHFNQQVLPAKIIIFDNEDGEKISQEFISHSWSKSLPFLHVPQIAALPKGYDARAVLFGAATQMGFEFIGAHEETKHQITLEKTQQEENQLDKSDDENIETSVESINIENKEDIDSTDKFETDEKDEEDKNEEILTENFGFVKNQDIALSKHSTDTNEEEKEDHKEINEYLHKESIGEPEDYQEERMPLNLNENKHTFKKKQSFLIKLLPIFNKIFTIIFGNIFALLKNTKKMPLPKMKAGKKAIFALPILIILIVGILAFYVYIPKAKITLVITPKVIEKEQNVIISSTSDSDFSKDIINGEVLSIEENGKLSIPTTGKKETGEKAKGTVTIYSRFDENKTFIEGTVITSSNDLQFTLDSDVKLASSSSDASSQPSTAKVSVTAKNIGKESNLPSNTKFTFGTISSSTIVAKNESAFSGGSKKEIDIVSKDDYDKLTSKILKELEAKAKEELPQKVSSDKAALPIIIDSEFIKKEFNKKIGDEAADLTLNAKVSYQVISYKRSDLDEFSRNLLQNDSKDMILSPEGIKHDLAEVKQKGKDLTGNLKIKASYLPKIENEAIIKQITGKSYTESEDFILKLPQISDVIIKVSPELPFLPQQLPRLSSNIVIETQTE